MSALAGPTVRRDLSSLVEKLTRDPSATEDPVVRLAMLREIACHSPAGLGVIAGRGQWQRAAHLNLLNERIVRCAEADEGRLIVSVTVRAGKALDVNTPIATPDGWTPIGKLVEGDLVFDETGQQCRVAEAFEPYWSDDVHEVRFRGGDTLIADGPHQWTCYSYKEAQALGQWRRYNGIENRAWDSDWAWDSTHLSPRSPKVRTTKDLYQADGTGTNRHRYYIPVVSGPIQTAPIELPMDPYVLGAWLGDGDTGDGVITKPDDCIFERIEAAGYTLSTRQGTGGMRRGVYGLKVELRGLGVLGNKHIPETYMRASPEQRLALLHGLMDTDGGNETGLRHIGTVSFTSQTKQLADGVAELFVSLGAKVTRDERPAKISGRATGKTAYRVSCSPPFNPFWCKHEAAGWSNDSKGALTRVTRVIEHVQPAEARMVRCIAVDSPSHLYLAGEAMVPTHNSSLGARWTPAWRIGTNPEGRVILGAHEQKLAASHSGFARNVLVEHGPTLYDVTVDPSTAAKADWGIEGRAGGMVAVGVGGSPIGRGADLMCVDDPLRSYADAMSERVRGVVNEDWFQGTMLTRLEPGASVIVICSRWHEEDLSGWLKTNFPGEWDELHIPALCDDPENDEMHRALGESFWPERWSKERLERTQKRVGPTIWRAQYQNRPSAPEGGMFPVKKLRYLKIDEVEWHRITEWGVGWDLAATEDGGDYTVGGLLGRYDDGRWLIAGLTRGQWGEATVRSNIRDRTNEWAGLHAGGTILVEIPQDPGQAGVAQRQQVGAMLSGHRVTGGPQTGSKDIRALGLASQVQMSNVDIITDAVDPSDGRTVWAPHVVDEMRSFPTGIHDDIVDAIAGIFNRMSAAVVVDDPLPDLFGDSGPEIITF